MHSDEKPQYGKLDYLKCQIKAKSKDPLTSVAPLLVTTTKLPLLTGIQGRWRGQGDRLRMDGEMMPWTASRAGTL